MKRILFTILIIISLTGDSYSQRIPFAFWNRLDPDTLELDAPTLIAPADDTTGVDQSPLLDWEGVLYATNYIVQLDNDTNFSPISWTDTTVNSKATVELGLVQGTTWYWRVLAFNIFDTSEWSVTYSFTVTTGPALTTPVLIFPADDTTNISQLPVLDWDTVINVRHYVVQLSDTTTFTTIHWSDSLTRSTATVDTTLDYSTTWYWRVIAYNDFDTSQWSDTNSFTVRDPNIAAPTLLTPANADTGQSQSPTLVWSGVDDADFYNVQLTQYSDFTSVLWNTNSFDTSKLVSMTLLEGTKWYWRVRSINATDTSSWSSTFAFIVTTGPAIARAYYIDATSGKDEYNGRSTALPWQTTDRVNEHTFIPGDSILFKGNETFENTNLVLSQSGTNINPIIVSSYNGSRATLNAPTGWGIYIYNGKGGVIIKNLNIVGDYNSVTQSGSDTTEGNSGIAFFNIPATVVAPSIIIDSCLITGFKQTGIGLGADTISKGYDSLRIRNCVIHNIGIIGIKAFSLRDGDFTITNNRIYNIRGRDGAGIQSVYGYSGAGISVGGIWGMTITRNLIYNCGEYADQGSTGIVTGNCKRVICSYNEVYGVKAAQVDGDAIDYDNNTDSSIVEYNYLHNCDGAGVMLSGLPTTGSSDNNIIRYNIIKNCGLKGGYPAILIFQAAGSLQPTGNIIHNNTTVSKKTGTSNPAGIMLSGRSTVNTRIKNNILLGDSVKQIVLDSAVQTGLVVQGNCYWDKRNIYYNIKWGGTTYTNLGNWRITSGQETSGGNSTMLIYNPLLNDPFTLRDTINNPYAIDTMTNYKYVDASLLRDAGVKTDSSYLWSANTRDFYGGIVPETSIYDIGAYEDTVTTTYTYSSYSKRLLSRDTNMVSQQDRYIKDSLIAGLVADTIWSKLDLFYIMAAPNQYAAKFNAIKDTFNLSAISSPTFTAYEGFTGNGTSSYLSTVWIPSTNAVNYTLNNAGMGVYSRTDASGSYAVMGALTGSNYIYLSLKNSSNRLSYWLNSSDFGTSAYTGPTTGFFSANRVAASGAGSENIYINGVYYNALTSTSSALPSNVFTLLQVSAADYSIHQLSFAYVSSSLTASNLVNFNQRVEKYLMRYGKNKEVPVTTTLLSPTNGEDSIATTLDTLDWSDVFNANTYHVQIDNNSDFSSLIGEITDLTNSRYIFGGVNPGAVGAGTLDSNEVYYWRVKGVNSNGNSEWSSTYSFNTHSVFQLESIDLFARCPIGIGSLARKFTIDSLIVALKADTIWSKADLIYMYAAEDTGSAKVNWKSSNYTSTIVGSPTFTANQGFTGNGSSAYLKTNWVPSTNGVNYLIDSSSVLAYVRTNVTETKPVIAGNNLGGTNFTRITPRNLSNLYEGIVNGNASSTIAVNNSTGMFSLIRSGATVLKLYKNDTLKLTSASSSNALSNQGLYVLARNNGGTAADFTTRQVAFIMVGGKFSDYTQTVIHRRIEWYLNRINAYVYVPSYVKLNSPANSATGVALNVDFDWDNVGANYYQIEIDDDIAFGTPYYSGNCSGSEETGENIGGFSNNTTYYWRVRGVNSIGTGAWSSTYSFTTTP